MNRRFAFGVILLVASVFISGCANYGSTQADKG